MAQPMDSDRRRRVESVFEKALDADASERARVLNECCAGDDALRSEVMPLNRKWNLQELVAAARAFPLRARERLTFEYVLLDGVNDRPENARELAELVRGVKAKINLIALNSGAELSYRTPTQERVAEFQRVLVGAGIPTFVRRPRGRDIFAACGQLKRAV